MKIIFLEGVRQSIVLRNIVIVAVVIGLAVGFLRMQGMNNIRRPYIVPKTTAEDNIDGNITKKIKVVVKKGTKKYVKIARAVKRNKKIKFTSTGNYVITYTVCDTAGNKAERKRYIAVIRTRKKQAAKHHE